MKKYLFSTMALSALMVGCSQEELAPKVDNVETEKEFVSVKGHDLLGPLTIKVGEETRVDANGWQNTDKIGLAWFDIEGDITKKQTVEKFKKENFTNDKIYGNHLFTTQGNNPFTTQTNVYQGAHFVYFPFERATQVAEKTVKLNGAFGVSQNDLDDYKYDRLNNVFHISTSDFISDADVDDDMKLTKQFTLSPVANTIKINTTPSEEFKTNETLKGLTLTSYVITAGTEVFETEFDVVTANVPIAQYEKNEDGTFKLDGNGKKILDVTANIKALDVYAAGIDADKTKTLSRDMAKDADYEVGTAHALPLHVLPISGYTSAKDKLSIIINVVTSTGLTGYFTINNPKGLTEGPDFTDNMKAINKLDKEMAEGGKLTTILRDDQKAWAQLGLNIDLTKANFTLDAKIKDYDQWADAVAIYEALGQDAELEVIGDVQFTNNIDTLTSGKITVTTDGEDAKMNIVGNVTLPSNTALDLTTNAPTVEVNGELIIKDGVKLDNKNVTNNGIITLGKLSQIGDKGKGITNNNRINVVYGSYAYLAKGEEGIVAYDVPSNYKYWELENLISLDEKENTGGLASVNTFVVGYDGNQRVTLDLNGLTKSEGSDDPYKPGEDTDITMPELAGITIEMEGGILTKGNGSESPVKEILVVKNSENEGDNRIIGVKVLNNITVNADAKAAMEGGSVSGNITNNGTFDMKDVKIAKEEKDESGAVIETATVITNNGEMTVDATKTDVGGVKKATFTASADKLVNTKNNKFTVGEGIATITIAEITNDEGAKITAANTNQVKFSKMTNNGILEKVTQIVQ